MAKITFDADTHTYTLDGMPCPSVTEITRFLHYKAEYSDKESRDRAARKGTAIHELTALIDYGEDVEIPPELSGYVQAWQNFKRDYRVEIVAIERVVGSTIKVMPRDYRGITLPKIVGYGLCGTIDRRANIEGVGGIIDIKTGSTVNKLALQAQLNAYALIDRDYYTDFMLGVYLRKDATYTLYEAPENYELVRNLYEIHLAEQEAKKRWKVTV